MNSEKRDDLISFRLYSPMEGIFFERKADGTFSEDDIGLTSYETVDYAEYVLAKVRSSGNGVSNSQGLERYLKDEGLQQRIASMVPTVEAYGGQLWGVLEVETYGELSGKEMELLISEWERQAIDGWGKQFSQKTIDVPNGRLQVEFGNLGPDYSIQEETEIKGELEQDIESPSACLTLQ